MLAMSWFQCRRCGSGRVQIRAGEPLLCDSCREERIADEKRQADLVARLGPGVVGPQPAICQLAECSRVFEAPSAGVKYCCGAHRARAWRLARRTAAAA